MDKIPPFQVGDRVVAIHEDPYGRYTMDTIYIVSEVWYCCHMWKWRVNMQGLPYTRPPHATNPGKCIGCGSTRPGWLSYRFRKVDEVSDYTTDSLLEELSIPEPVFAEVNKT
jgi:hypothetical protein